MSKKDKPAKYLIQKEIDKDGNEKYNVAIYRKVNWGVSLFLNIYSGYSYSDESLLGLNSVDEAKEAIQKREEAINFSLYVHV